MPQLGRTFSPIEVGETNTLSIGFGAPIWSMARQSRVRIVFASQLAVGETITGVTWGCAAREGTDPNAAACLGDEARTSTIASVSCSGFLAGVTYAVEATATTSMGQVLKAWTTILCVASAVPASPPSTPSGAFQFNNPLNSGLIAGAL